MIRIGLIDPAPCQTPNRTTETATQSLLEQIVEAGGILSPIHVVRQSRSNQATARFTVADGHRRLECARRLANEAIDCIVYPHTVSPSELWAALNLPTRKVSATDWFYGWASLSELKEERELFERKIPHNTLGAINAVVKILGRARAVELGLSERRTPSIVNAAYAIHAVIASRLGVDAVSKRDLLEWLFEHGSGPSVYAQGRHTKAGIRRLVARVKANKPYPPTEWC